VTEIIQELAVLLVIIGIGVYFGHKGLLDAKCSEQLNRMVIHIAFPALILSSMDKDFTIERLEDSFGLISISWLCFGAVIVFLEIWKRVSKRQERELGLLRFLVIFGNTAFMGYPIIRAIYGEDGVFYASMFNLAHNFVCFSYGLSLLKPGRQIKIRELFCNIGFLATAIGFVIFLIPDTLPYILHRPLSWLGDMTIPICLLIMGAKLGRSRLCELVRPRAIWMTSLIRLVVFPTVLLIVLSAFHLPQRLVVIPTIIFGTPVALTASLFAEEYGNDGEVASRAVVLSNLLAVATLPIWVWVLMRVTASG
jgi:hypothetical protein